MRTREQGRLAGAYHEAAHATAVHLMGQRVQNVELMANEGVCWVEDYEVRTLAQAQDRIVIYLAGETFVRAAWAAGLLSDDEIGGRTSEDITAEEIAHASTPAHASAHYRPSTPDEQSAEAIAEQWTTSDFEREALLNYLRHRTNALVEDPRFVQIATRIAGALLEHSRLDGDLLIDLLDHAEETAHDHERSTA